MEHKGRIIKGIAGFYYVKADNVVFECKARGIFKKDKIIPLVGDNVIISINSLEEKTAIIEKIMPRNVEMIRPRVANVDQAVVVIALKNPEPHKIMIDKLTVLIEKSGLDLVICFNKCDLDSEGIYKEFYDIYKSTGYRIISTSAYDNSGLDELKEVLDNKVSVLAGPSGVGKSSILNVIQRDLHLKTGLVSKKIKRGKHTTRHSELIELDFGGFVVDTPGFTSLDITSIEMSELKEFFPEFKNDKIQCKFSDCYHEKEPKCGVKLGVENGLISKSRYESYLYLLNEIKENRRHKKW
ncbi:ribosome small subunit-dependent GTPase A [Helicovermis profundi]|uniref:Small ribosomal subunit biogenesis GTPase RsgA n=1 Tax=Helicovermis profundi TaxID=3065157 RepID=A0AAU9EIQ6_9FIRM|nr:ribosome small subunit-dependent GTPase A [Clostridia bacterium S502]